MQNVLVQALQDQELQAVDTEVQELTERELELVGGASFGTIAGH